MKEKTKKILKGAGITLGAIALLGLGVGIGACSVKNGATQPVTTTPIRKGLNQRPNRLPDFQKGENLLGEGQPFNSYNGVYAYNDYMINYGEAYGTYLRTLNAGYYFLDIENGDEGLTVVKYQTDFSKLDNLFALGQLLNPNQRQNYPEGVSGSYIQSGGKRSYFYLEESATISISFSKIGTPTLYLVDTMDIPAEDILELPDNWSPLRMVAKNVNKENNLIFGTDWNYWADVPQANGQPMLDLSTILFKNQGRVYNHIYIYFKNLNGLKYATNSENLGTGNSTDWCADRVEYAFVIGKSLKYNYLAASVGTSILQSETVFNLGLNWSNPSARKLEVLDKRYPDLTAISNTLTGRFPRNGTNSLDPITGETIKPFGYGVWDYEYLFEYSNITSVDFVLGGSSDVFGIFTNAFNSVIPLLSVQVLPSISLGILLFLPLIGGIIVVIIRVIKK